MTVGRDEPGVVDIIGRKHYSVLLLLRSSKTDGEERMQKGQLPEQEYKPM